MSVKHAPAQTLNWSKCAFDFCAQNFGHWNPGWHQGYYERRSEISYSSPCILRIFSTAQNQTLDYPIWILHLDSSIQVGLTLQFYFTELCMSRKFMWKNCFEITFVSLDAQWTIWINSCLQVWQFILVRFLSYQLSILLLTWPRSSEKSHIMAGYLNTHSLKWWFKWSFFWYGRRNYALIAKDPCLPVFKNISRGCELIFHP